MNETPQRYANAVYAVIIRLSAYYITHHATRLLKDLVSCWQRSCEI